MHRCRNAQDYYFAEFEDRGCVLISEYAAVILKHVESCLKMAGSHDTNSIANAL